MVLKLSKTVSFLQFFADISKKSKAVIAIYVYTSGKFSFRSFRKWCWSLCYDLEDLETLEFEFDRFC